jgi:hypothetical protein
MYNIWCSSSVTQVPRMAIAIVNGDFFMNDPFK